MGYIIDKEGHCRHVNFRRDTRALNWTIEQGEPLIWQAEALALHWMQREYTHKGKIKGGLLNKTCGILGELTFRAMLDELKVAHTATEPLFDKMHDVNADKIYDFRLSDGTTIDIKTLLPRAYKAVRVNQYEVQEKACDYYVLYSCLAMYGDNQSIDAVLLDKESAELGMRLWSQPEKYEDNLQLFHKNRSELEKYIKVIMRLKFVTFVEGNALVRPENLKTGDFGPYYSLKVPDTLKPPFHSYEEFAANVLHVTLT